MICHAVSQPVAGDNIPGAGGSMDAAGYDMKKQLRHSPIFAMPIPERNASASRATSMDDYRWTIETLGFDTTPQRLEAVKYVRADGNDLNLLTTAWRSYRPNGIKDSITRKGQVYNETWLTEARLKGHCLAWAVRQAPTKGQRKLWKGYSDDVMRAAYLIDSKTIALSQYPVARILALDLDNHSGTPEGRGAVACALYTIVKELGVHPLYLERSTVNGGFHVFFDFGCELDYNDISILVRHLSRVADFKIEARTESHALVLPCSITYQAHDLLDLNHAMNTVNLRPIPREIQVNWMCEVLWRHANQRVVERSVYNRITGRDRRWKASAAIRATRNANCIAALIDDERYMIGPGDRQRVMTLLVSRVLNYGGCLDDYREVIRANDRGSKDLASWSDERFERETAGMWMSMSKHHIDRGSYARSPRLRSERIRTTLQDPIHTAKILRGLGTIRRNKQRQHQDEISRVLAAMLEFVIRKAESTGESNFWFCESVINELCAAERVTQDARRLVRIILRDSGLFTKVRDYEYHGERRCSEYVIPCVATEDAVLAYLASVARRYRMVRVLSEEILLCKEEREHVRDGRKVRIRRLQNGSSKIRAGPGYTIAGNTLRASKETFAISYIPHR